MDRVHLDHNATTPLRPEVREHWLDCLDRFQGNPSSVHRSGRMARQMLDQARERAAAALCVHEDEILFTSGGTESNNLALLGALRPLGRSRGLVTCVTEHSSVLAAAAQLEEEGHAVSRVPVDAQAFPDLDRLAQVSTQAAVALVSIHAANNEVGTIAPLESIGARLRRSPGRPPWLHTDAVQALGRARIELDAWGIDLASFSAHKIGGPLGVGLLYKRKGIALLPVLFGGGQEHALRPGTENVPAISAACLAVELAVRERVEHEARMRALCRSFWRQLQDVVPGVRLLGPPIDAQQRLCNTLNVVFDGVDGRMLVARLDLEGLEVSAGSACASGSLEPSHVLLAMGLSAEEARAGLRVSMGRTTHAKDINSAVDILGRTIVSAR